MAKGGPTIKRGESSGEHGTPWEFIHAVEAKFGPLGLDLAASHDNRKAPNFLSLASGHAEAVGSLGVEWAEVLNSSVLRSKLAWLNPPFANIRPWAEKCHVEMRKGANILLLVPASVGANWYWDEVHGIAEEYSVGRMTFEGSSDPYPKDLLLAHYRPGLGHSPKPMERWRWQLWTKKAITTRQTLN